MPNTIDTIRALETTVAFARRPERYPRKSATPIIARLPIRYTSRTGRHADEPETWTTNSSPASVTVRSCSISPVSSPDGRAIWRTPISPEASNHAMIAQRGTAAVHTTIRMKSVMIVNRLIRPNNRKTSTYSSTVEERCRRTVDECPGGRDEGERTERHHQRVETAPACTDQYEDEADPCAGSCCEAVEDRAPPDRHPASPSCSRPTGIASDVSIPGLTALLPVAGTREQGPGRHH